MPSQRLAAASRGKTHEIIQMQYSAKLINVYAYTTSTFRGNELFPRQSTCVTWRVRFDEREFAEARAARKSQAGERAPARARARPASERLGRARRGCALMSESAACDQTCPSPSTCIMT